MSDHSSIEWTDASWNPIRAKGELGRHFCQKISDGCRGCYASTLNHRFRGQAYEQVSAAAIERAKQLVVDGEIYLDEQVLMEPLRWKRARRIFVCSMTDLFGEWVTDEWLDKIFAVMASAPRHAFQLLTKRPTRMRGYMVTPDRDEAVGWAGNQLYEQSSRSEFSISATLIHRQRYQLSITGVGRICPTQSRWPLPNVWLGTSIESDRYAWRAKVLAETPAAVRFISAEPLLGPLPRLDLECADCGGAGQFCVDNDHDETCKRCNGSGLAIHWIVAGGESGPGARTLDLDWVRDLRYQCHAAGSAFFCKQLGRVWARANGSRDGKGGEMDDWPGDLRIRGFPAVPAGSGD